MQEPLGRLQFQERSTHAAPPAASKGREPLQSSHPRRAPAAERPVRERKERPLPGLRPPSRGWPVRLAVELRWVEYEKTVFERRSRQVHALLERSHTLAPSRPERESDAHIQPNQ